MKKLFLILFITLFTLGSFAQKYEPTPQNLEARSQFQDRKFGLFIHFGLYSILGRGEWVLNNDEIKFKDYKRLMDFFNPQDFNAEEWVSMAKNAGMKYITLVTRHHDGFSMWDTKYSDFNIMNTPFKKDLVKLLADECHRQGIKIAFYYSTLDWGREDYPHETGRTGQHTGRTGKGDYDHYLTFMKNQLTELLTNYGEVSGIWFDGHWDQTNEEGKEDRSSRIDWKYDEIYGLIHKLQPQCLIGNNHHLDPIEGEDFQMFERDLPGENTYGLSFQEPAEHVPVEVCETMTGSWGFNIKDDKYKSVKQLIDMLVGAAGRNTNLLLNVGPMPNGKIQPENVDTLAAIGEWMKKNGESIYGTRGKVMEPQDWGVVTIKDGAAYVHILNRPSSPAIEVSGIPKKVKKSFVLGENRPVKYQQKKDVLALETEGLAFDGIDTIIKLEFK